MSGLVGSASSGFKYREVNNQSSKAVEAPSASETMTDKISPPVEVWLTILKYIRTTPALPCESPKKVERVVWSIKELLQVAQVSSAARKAVFDILKKPRHFAPFVSQIRPDFFSEILWDYLDKALLSKRDFFRLLEGCSPTVTLISSSTVKTPFLRIEEVVDVNIHAFLIKRFIGFSQKIQKDSVTPEELELLLSKLFSLEEALSSNNLGPISVPGYVLSNFDLYLNFASSKTFHLFIDFLIDKYKDYKYDPISQLCKEVVRHSSPERRNELWQVLFSHPFLKSKNSRFIGKDGTIRRCINVEGILYTKNGLLSGEGTLKYVRSRQFEGIFKKGKPFDGTGCFFNMLGFETFEGSLKNGKPDGEVKINRSGSDAQSGFLPNQFEGLYENGFPREGRGEVLDLSGRKFHFDEGYGYGRTPNSLQKVTFPNGDVCYGPFEDFVDSVSQEVRTMGFYKFADGSTYVGELKEFRPHGSGSRVFPNGDSCEIAFNFEELAINDRDSSQLKE